MVVISPRELKAGYDVIVVGFGTAGSSVANSLSDKFRVLVVDSKHFPRSKPCGGMIVNQSKDFLKDLNPPNYVFVEPKSLDITYLDLDNGLKKKVEKGFLNADRSRFDSWLQSLSVNRPNVSFLSEAKLIDFYPSSDKKFTICLIESNGSVSAILTRFLVGCEGANSLVRQRLCKNKTPFYLAIQQFYKNGKIKDSYFVFSDEVTDYYCWIIPKNDLL